MSEKVTIFSTPRFDIVRSEREDGGEHFLIQKPDAVSVALEHEGRFLLLEVRRSHDRQVSIEFPGGRIEAGETAMLAAQRELAEETGAMDIMMEPLCAISPLPAFVSEVVHVFRARAAPGAAGVVGHEEIAGHRWADRAELVALCRDGAIRSAVDGYIALLLARG